MAEDDIHSLLTKICRTYASVFRRRNLRYLLSLYAFFRHNFTYGHEPHQTSFLNDVHTNMGEKQLKTPDFINNIFLKPDF